MGGETLGVDDGLHSFEDLLWFEYDTPNTRVPDTDTGIDTVCSVLIPHVITCTRTDILASTPYHLDTSGQEFVRYHKRNWRLWRRWRLAFKLPIALFLAMESMV